jgi:hypothetical protein
MVGRPHLRVADVFRSGWGEFRAAHGASAEQRRVARHVMDCRTAALGGRLHRCGACGAEVPLYNSCRDRHCPTCQTTRKQRWLEQRRAEVLPAPYFHAVFTLPHALNALVAANRTPLLNELFGTANWVLRRFAADPRWKLRGQPGFVAVLHTWSQRLTAHYHLHCLVAGGAWDAGAGVWRGAHGRFLFGKDALASAFRARFIRRLESLRGRGKLAFDGDPAAWDALIRRLWDTKWIVYPKATSGTPEQTLDYLGRYTHRVAISDHRILDVSGGSVTFSWRDRADGNALKEMTLTCAEFVGRYLLHVLPKGFQKVRAYGFLAPRAKQAALAAIRASLGAEPPAPPPEGETAPERVLRLTGVDVTLCPVCKAGRLAFERPLPRARDGPS